MARKRQTRRPPNKQTGNMNQHSKPNQTKPKEIKGNMAKKETKHITNQTEQAKNNKRNEDIQKDNITNK